MKLSFNLIESSHAKLITQKSDKILKPSIPTRQDPQTFELTNSKGNLNLLLTVET